MRGEQNGEERKTKREDVSLGVSRLSVDDKQFGTRTIKTLKLRKVGCCVTCE